jgi:transposase
VRRSTDQPTTNGAGLGGLLRELKRPGVTMMALCEEYRAINQEGYGYSRFCDLLCGFERRLTPVMRQHRIAGEKALVDYSGQADRDRRSGDGRNP